MGEKQGIEEGAEKGFKKGIKQGKKEGIQEGLQKGAEESKKEVVINMLNEGMNYDIISKITGKTVEEIKEIEETITEEDK